ncbi:isopentenyl-diphosphate Delta-isomerase [Jiangella rhizosphaerae]|uniref:Isopentenyl-diphosphate Delta-isomerase n=1 Tax=Jiangella rhizosphaerae TaxID=2293569 RepID=A0A418KG16_9ACTN|nr:isopentenyl-diphosphate Delta-isomerase [Jiangella rhizosphaerae]RIQ10808.1 isopentenyl-diphosphate Delta-isomerase [Jiangella rhizosphaerae]
MADTLLGERVVLLDPAGEAVGTALKSEVHHAATPLHLAFSCYVFDAAGSLLVTRRAAGKATWPDVWTNSFCGHPGPDEDMAAALARRAADELTIRLSGVRPVLPRFRYRAVMPNGVVENEVCPVFAAVTADRPEPHPSEVDAVEWVAWPTFRDDVLAGRREVSPWCAWQVAELAALPDDPLAWPPGDWRALPPAALGSAA